MAARGGPLQPQPLEGCEQVRGRRPQTKCRDHHFPDSSSRQRKKHAMTVPDVQRADSPHNDNFEDFRMAWLRQVASDRWLNNRAGSVAIALCEHADPATRLARPVQQQIADRLGITDRTVRAVVTGMAQRGHLQVTVRRNQQPNTYRLVLVEGRANV
jgi:hypothetical protein